MTVLAASQANPRDIAVRGAFVYWVNRDMGEVQRIERTADGGTPLTLATGQSCLTHVTVDDTYVYWISDNVNGNAYRTVR